MIRELIQTHVSQAIERLKSAGALPADLSTPVEIADPKDPSHGDFATSWALAASKAAGKYPRELAEMLKGELESPEKSGDPHTSYTTHRSYPADAPLFSAIEVAGPGFLNFRLADAAWLDGIDWANSRAQDIAKPQRPTPSAHRLNVEFVSVNPNGPITVGSGRGAAFGSTLCNVLEAAGHSVHREYYINDGTNSEQMRQYGDALRRYAQRRLGVDILLDSIPYKGDFVDESSSQIKWATKEHIERSYSLKTRDYQLLLQQIEFLKQVSRDPSFSLSEQTSFANELKEDVEFLRLTNGDIQLLADSLTHIAQIEGTLEELISAFGTTYLSSIDVIHFQNVAKHLTLERQRADLCEFGVTFDTWFSEQSLHDSGKVAESIAHLNANGAADEKPERRKLKLAKGGVIEDVIVEQQPVDDEEESGGEGLGAKGDEAASPLTLDPSRAPVANPTLWLRSTKFGDDMDRVLRRKDGRLTYISSDIAYHKDKFERGSKPDAQGKTEKADKLITILGPDHHGYIARLHAVLAALEVGDRTDRTDPTDLTEIETKLYTSPEERDACLAALAKARAELEVLIFQIVRFVKDGKPAPMRKRDGNIYSLRDLMAEIGKDAAPSAPQEEQMRIGKDVARFFYLMRSHDTHMDFDIDLATKGTDENPVFYVQYAHARICSILEKADLHPPAPSSFSAGAKNKEGEPLHPKEVLLIKKILDLPDEVARCAQDYGVHRLTTYAVELARTFHHFYDACRVIQPETPALQAQRLAICEATRHALRGALELLGISAPERMERESASES